MKSHAQIRRSPWRAAGARTLVATLVAGLLGAAQATAAAGSAQCVASAPTKAAARAMAKACKTGVEVLGARTEQDLLTALPDGSFKLEHRYRPVRVQRPDGSWTPVDTTLRFAPDGTVVPGATTAKMTFSGGGTTPLVSLVAKGHLVDVGAPFGALPKPVLTGNVATYPDVLPGVDLRMTADVEGYTEVLVVKDRTAADNPRLQKIDFPVSGAGTTTTLDEAGNVRIVDDTGDVLLGGAMPRMWDSSEHFAQGEPVVHDHSHAEPVLRTEVASAAGAKRAANARGKAGEVSHLSVSPSLGFLFDPRTVYPVMIDPPQTQYKLGWTYVSADCGGCTNWNSSADAQTGPIGGHTHRSFFAMSMAGLSYKNIVQATFEINLLWTAASYWKETDLYDVGSIYSSTTWNAQPAKRTYLGTVTVNAPTNGLAWNITGQVQYASNNAWGDETVGLYSQSDSDWAFGKRWSNNPAMVVIYNDWPNTPTPQAFSQVTDCYKSCTSPAVVRTTQPTLNTLVSDPNGGQVRADYEVRTAASDTATLVTSYTAGPVMSGNTIAWKIPAGLLTNGSMYYWRARARDEMDWLSGWTGWQSVLVDTTAPQTPTASSTQYPYKQWGSTVGTSGQFSFSEIPPFNPQNPSAPRFSDTVEFQWSVAGQGGTTTTPSGMTAGCETICAAVATVSFTPAKDMVQTMSVTAVDGAGNTSTTALSHVFWVKPLTNRCWRWKLDETSSTTAGDTGNLDSAAVDPACHTLTDNTTITAQPGTLSTGVTWGTNAGAAPRDHFATFNGTGQITMPSPVIDTTKSFTVMAWVRPSALTGYETIISQDGVTMSRFVLRYDKDQNGGAWCFGMRASDTSGSNPVYACATGTQGNDSVQPAVGEWVHLAGVFDASTGQIQLHVMGGDGTGGCNGETVTTSFTSSWSGSGPLVIGRAQTSSAASNRWSGDIDQIYAFQRPLAISEVCQQTL